MEQRRIKEEIRGNRGQMTFNIENLSDRHQLNFIAVLVDMTNKGQFKSECPLQILCLQSNDIELNTSSVQNLNYCLRYGNLTLLDLSSNNLGNSGLEHLCFGLIGKIKLQKLLLADCKFGR